jgi:hypothetical protein
MRVTTYNLELSSGLTKLIFKSSKSFRFKMNLQEPPSPGIERILRVNEFPLPDHLSLQERCLAYLTYLRKGPSESQLRYYNLPSTLMGGLSRSEIRALLLKDSMMIYLAFEPQMQNQPVNVKCRIAVMLTYCNEHLEAIPGNPEQYIYKDVN